MPDDKAEITGGGNPDEQRGEAVLTIYENGEYKFMPMKKFTQFDMEKLTELEDVVYNVFLKMFICRRHELAIMQARAEYETAQSKIVTVPGNIRVPGKTAQKYQLGRN